MTDDLAHSVLRYTNQQSGKSPFATAIAGLTILRSDHPKPLSHMIIKPALCITLQGAKWTAFGERRFDYEAGQALVVGVEMPAVGQVTQASPDQPYLGLVIELDLGVMREVIESLEIRPVGAAVGNVRNNGPQLLEPVAAGVQTLFCLVGAGKLRSKSAPDGLNHHVHSDVLLGGAVTVPRPARWRTQS